MEYPNFPKNQYLLFNRIVDVEPHSFYYRDETTGEDYPCDGGLMFECFVFSKLPGKTDNLIKLQIADHIYSKIKKLDEEQIVKYLADLNSIELLKIKTEQKFWENNKNISGGTSGKKKQRDYLSDLEVRFENWFHINNITSSKNLEYLTLRSDKKIIWNRTEQELRLFISLCVKHNLIEKPENFEQYIVNFIIEGSSDLNNLKPIMIKLKTSNRDLIYIIYKLSYNNIIRYENDIWDRTSQVFIGKNNKLLKPKALCSDSKMVMKSKRTLPENILSDFLPKA